jgi:hypothetical protein
MIQVIVHLAFDRRGRRLLATRHAGAAHDALRSTVGQAAKLTVRENETEGPVLVRWKPFPGCAVYAPAHFHARPASDTGDGAERIHDADRVPA